jgi:hypothetical protein
MRLSSTTIDTFDTFLDAAHVREAFGERAVVFDSDRNRCVGGGNCTGRAAGQEEQEGKRGGGGSGGCDNGDVTCAPPYRLLVPRNAI